MAGAPSQLGELTALPRPLTGLRWPTSKGRGRGRREERERIRPWLRMLRGSGNGVGSGAKLSCRDEPIYVDWKKIYYMKVPANRCLKLSLWKYLYLVGWGFKLYSFAHSFE